jgi:acyl dehydratase
MRLLVESEFKPAGGIVGAGFEMLEVRPSKSRPGQGLIKVRTTTLNQNGEAVQIHLISLSSI